ncbi:MAG: UvrD-helicase domain-containing protein [Candidatus Marinimicrobia bacterium]|nr:UvrD-helicase domain-containing protein [Candidatus Neomarinimicrobiota bacterium]
MDPLRDLNPQQKSAVEYLDGEQLIFAGAGSGKTKVLTHKIAYLIKSGIVRPDNILAVTFTNKAAQELRNRVEKFVEKQAGFIHIGTFHSICARILRKEIEHLGYSKYFSIYDESDQRQLIKKVISDSNIDLEGFLPKNVLSRISYLKNWLTSPEDFKPRPGNRFEYIVEGLYPLYQKALKRSNAVDFDDLLLLPLKLFDKEPKLLEKYRLRYQYILVDEYQDTNKPQFLFIDLLAKKHRNLCVVGDDDQSIYSWRGANIENILKFDAQYPECRVFKLEQNYRSTNNILKAASGVVANNINRVKKELWSRKSDGDLLIKIEAESDYDEAAKIAVNIRQEILKKKRTFKDFAILYRTNAQTRILEEILRRNNIPYNIIGGVKFYERKEIKDILAYFSVLSNPKDDVSLRRILNFPPRGIGKQTLSGIDAFAVKKQLTLFEALNHVDFLELSKRSKKAVQEFIDMIKRIDDSKEKLAFEEWTRIIIDELGLRSYYKEQGGEESIQRLANIDELLNDISEFCTTVEEANLEAYLEKVSLLTNIDVWEDEKNTVSLMTLHSAKGLEFPVVIICGLNQGLFPLDRDNSEKAVEEERRLFYVGLTRAMEKIFLSSAQVRNRAGEMQYLPDSIFLSEIPKELIEVESLREGVIASKRRRYSRRNTSEVAYQGTDMPTRRKTAVRGSIVSHKIFGVGKVIEVNGMGDGAKLHINFQSCGTKVIVAKFVQVK